jgi:hypothetical protein
MTEAAVDQPSPIYSRRLGLPHFCHNTNKKLHICSNISRRLKMSEAKQIVILDDKGDVHKGIEIARQDHTGTDLVGMILTAGISMLAGKTPDTVTIATEDGRKISGRELEFDSK